ncbi:MAG: DolP-mannose mannosyltransferase, partial [Chloroflexi bacterium]|nr:DolP-mannose mannosyltransferase [Chloroflexota bacterium]
MERVKSAGHWLAPLLVFALAAFVYSLYGLDGNLGRDPAIFLYAGQRMADGVPPYVSIFDHKAPLAYILPGLGVIISRLWGGDDIYTVRLLFFTMSCLTAVAVFLLGSSIFERHWVGFFAALTFLGFEPFAQGAGSGPKPKTPVVLFVTLNLLFTSQRKWFWAGLFGSLSLLVWQPTAIFPLITLVLAILRPRPERKAGITKTLLGIVSPV